MSTAVVKFASDTSSFQKGANQVNSSLQNIKTVAAGVGTALAAIGAINFAANLAGGIKDSIVGASKAAASYETMRIQLEVLTGSAATAGKLLGELVEYGATTPLEQKDLQAATKTLLAFGVGVKDVMPNLKMLGDISGGDGEKLQSLARAFGKVSAAGKATMEDINILRDAGFDPLQSIAKKLGISMVQMNDRVSDGQMTLSDLKGAMSEATSEGGRFFQMLTRISGTTEGRLSNLADNITQLQVAFGTGFNEGLGSVVDGLNTSMPKLSETLEKLGAIAGKMITDLTPVIEQFVNDLPAALESGNIWSSIRDNLVKVLKSEEVRSAASTLVEGLYPGGKTGLTATEVGAGVIGGSWAVEKITNLFKMIKSGAGIAIGAGATEAGAATSSMAGGARLGIAGLVAAAVGLVGGYGIGNLMETGNIFGNVDDYAWADKNYVRSKAARDADKPKEEEPKLPPPSDWFAMDRKRRDEQFKAWKELVPNNSPLLNPMPFKPEMLLRSYADRTKKIGDFSQKSEFRLDPYKPVLDSLEAIGGAGGPGKAMGAQPVVTEAKKQTTLLQSHSKFLKNIEKNTSKNRSGWSP